MAPETRVYSPRIGNQTEKKVEDGRESGNINGGLGFPHMKGTFLTIDRRQ